MVDNLPLPPLEADPTDAPVALDPPATLDLRAEEIASVIWCTGFGGDFSYLDPALLDADGQPRRRRGPGPVVSRRLPASR